MKARKSTKQLKKPVKVTKATPTKTSVAKKKMRLVKPAAKTKPGTTKAAAAAPAPAKRAKGREAAPKRQLEVVKRKAPKAKQREEDTRVDETEPEVALTQAEFERDEPAAAAPEIEDLEEIEEVEEVEEVEELDELEADAPLISDISEIRARAGEGEEASSANDVSLEDFEAPAPTTRMHLKRVIESLIFVSDQAVTPNQLGRLVKAKQAEVRELVLEIKEDFEGRGIELVEVGGGYQFRSAAASAPFVRDLVAQRPVRLTRAQLETLALIAYRQPITRPEIDDVRGVDGGSAIKVLLDRDLVKILGRKDEAGRPLLYGTTPQFLDFFGMKNLQDLPTLREFTELSDENRELFQRKMGEIPDLSDPAYNPSAPHRDEPLDEEELAARGEPPADAPATPEADQPPAPEPDSRVEPEPEGVQEEPSTGEVEARDEDDDEGEDDDDDEDADLDPEAEAEAEIDAELDPDDEERDDESDEAESEDDESEDDESEDDDGDEGLDDDDAVAQSDPEDSEDDEERDDDESDDEEREDESDEDEDDEDVEDGDEDLEDEEPVAEADPTEEEDVSEDDDAPEHDADAEGEDEDDDEDDDDESEDDDEAGEDDEASEDDDEDDEDEEDRA
jgi:segregation and condensation protein B